MARFQDTDPADGTDDADVAGHGMLTDVKRPGPMEGAAPRRPKIDADDHDTEGHLYGAGPSTQGEAFPHPATTRTAIADGGTAR